MDFDRLRQKTAEKVKARRADPKPLLFVVNCKTPMAKWPTSSWHYIGRKMKHSPVYVGSALANPYRLSGRGNDDAEREAVIADYRVWLWSRIQDETSDEYLELVKILRYSLSLDGCSLGCWCAPKRCHGEIIIDAVNWLWSQGVRPEGWTVESIR